MSTWDQYETRNKLYRRLIRLETNCLDHLLWWKCFRHFLILKRTDVDIGYYNIFMNLCCMFYVQIIFTGFKDDMMKQIFRIIGAVLHFGNVEIQPDQHESCKIEVWKNTKTAFFLDICLCTMTFLYILCTFSGKNADIKILSYQWQDHEDTTR